MKNWAITALSALALITIYINLDFGAVKKDSDVRLLAPDFSLPIVPNKLDLRYSKWKSANLVSLNEIKAEFILVNFWASWCEVCQSEEGYLGALSQSFLPNRLMVLGIAANDSLEGIKASGKHLRRNYLLALDKSGVVAQRYAVGSLPYSVLLDEKRRIILTVSGTINPKNIRKISNLVSSKSGEDQAKSTRP